jgi:hypothetical protein
MKVLFFILLFEVENWKAVTYYIITYQIFLHMQTLKQYQFL